MHQHRIAMLVAVSATAFVPTMALGQPATSPPQAGEALNEMGIADIVVTAQRRAESAQRAAIAISVLTPENLNEVTQADQLTQLAPALQIGAGGGSTPLYYVRGVGTFSANPYTDSAVALNYDGVYIGRPSSSSGMFYDLERIEVLKGPQGTLYGRNATGGALNVIPARPHLGVSSMDLNVSVGNYQTINTQAAINLPVSSNAALRVAGTVYGHDGYMSDDTYDEHGQGVRAQLLLEPSSTLSVRVGGDYFHQSGTGGTASIYGLRDPSTGAVTRTSLSTSTGFFDPKSVAILNSSATYFPLSGAPFGELNSRPKMDNEYYGVNAEISGDLGFAKLTFLPAYRESILRSSTAATAFILNNFETDKQLSSELRLDGTIGPVDWLAGGYYFRETVDSLFNISANLLGGVQNLKAVNRSLAGFGRLTAHLSDRLRLTAAGRYTADKKRFDGLAESPIAICLAPSCSNIRRLPAFYSSLADAFSQIGYIQVDPSTYVDATGTTNVIYHVTNIAVNKTLKQNKFTYRLAAEFDVAPQSLLYASMETGYRSGGFSFSTLNPTYDPETITAYTLGIKNRFLNNRLQLNVEAFLWKYKNQQAPHFSLEGSNQVFITENIGKSTNKGVEVEMVARPWENTTFHTDIQYLHTKLDSFTYEDPSPVTACAVGPLKASGTYTVDCSGRRALRSPTWTLNLGVDQVVPLSASYQLDLSVNTHYQSASQLMFEHFDLGRMGAYWLSDASIGLSGTDRKWSIAAYVNNIENKRVLGNLTYFASNVITAVTSPPRIYGLRGRFSF